MKVEKGKKGKKKWIIIGAVVVIVVILAAILKSAATKAVSTAVSTAVTSNTAEVTSRTLTKSVGATGTIKSIESKDISVDLTGVKLSEIDVAVGDKVSEGDLLLKFDTSDLEEKLSEAKESLENTETQNSLTLDSANRSYNDTVRSANYSVDSAKTQMDQAEKNLTDTQKDLESAQSQLEYYEKMRDAYATNVKNAKAAYSAALDTETKAESDFKKAETEYIAKEAVSDNDPTASNISAAQTAEEKMKTAQTTYIAAQKATVTASTNLSNMQNDYQTYVADCSTWEAKVDAYKEQIDSLTTAYETEVKAYNNTVASTNSSVASAKDSLQSTKVSQSGSTDSLETQVENYEDQVENGTVYAPISGVVTAINYEAGDTYNGGALITVQDCSSFIIETEITEYDISDIEVGQKVLIKTNATGDEEMEGVVTFVSPTATKGSTSITYTVKISITNPSDRLRLDMSANLSIILSEHENAITVPYNAVQQDEDGNYFVTKMNGAETEIVYVTVVTESNYYTEIESDDLAVGDTVLLKTSETTSLYDMMMDEEGDF